MLLTEEPKVISPDAVKVVSAPNKTAPVKVWVPVVVTALVPAKVLKPVTIRLPEPLVFLIIPPEVMPKEPKVTVPVI